MGQLRPGLGAGHHHSVLPRPFSVPVRMAGRGWRAGMTRRRYLAEMEQKLPCVCVSPHRGTTPRLQRPALSGRAESQERERGALRR